MRHTACHARPGAIGILLLAAFLPAPEPAAAGTRMLYLVRHGHYDTKDSADARVGKRLTPLGREQAALVARRLAALPVPFAAVHTSGLTRAMETGDIIARRLRLAAVRDTLLNECTPPSTRADIRWDTPGEADSAQAQLEAAWGRFVRPAPGDDVHEVLACHGNVIRWFVTRALGVDTRQWGSMDIGNGSLTILTVRDDGFTRVVMFSDVGHLPLGKQTWAGRGPGWAK